MSGSLRAAAGRTMDRGSELVRESADKPNKHSESNLASESAKPVQHGCTCHSARTCDCRDGECADNDGECPDCKCYNCGCESRNKARHTDCSCTACTGYADYIDSTNNTPGKDTGTRIRISDEPRASERPSATSKSNTVEYITGIQSGVAI